MHFACKCVRKNGSDLRADTGQVAKKGIPHLVEVQVSNATEAFVSLTGIDSRDVEC